MKKARRTISLIYALALAVPTAASAQPGDYQGQGVEGQPAGGAAPYPYPVQPYSEYARQPYAGGAAPGWAPRPGGWPGVV